MDYWMPRVLVIGPGDEKILKVMGFLSPIIESGLLQYTDTYGGVEIGSVICLLLIADYDIRQIVRELSFLNIIDDASNLTIGNIKDTQLISSEPIRQILTELILDKFGDIPNLHNLYLRTGKSLNVVTQYEIMGPFTHPHVSCIDAVMLSLVNPLSFYQLNYENKNYASGLYLNPYPVDYFDNSETNILGVYIKTISEKKSHSSLMINNDNFKFLESMIDNKINQIINNTSVKCRNVKLEAKSDSTKTDLLVEGFNEGKFFLNQMYNNTYLQPDIPKELKYDYPQYYLLEEEV